MKNSFYTRKKHFLPNSYHPNKKFFNTVPESFGADGDYGDGEGYAGSNTTEHRVEGRMRNALA